MNVPVGADGYVGPPAIDILVQVLAASASDPLDITMGESGVPELFVNCRDTSSVTDMAVEDLIQSDPVTLVEWAGSGE